MAVKRHLSLREVIVSPAGEWVPDHEGWTVVRLADGAGYCLKKDASRELNAGDGLVVGFDNRMQMRASALSSMRLQFFTVYPQYLGILTVEEWYQFKVLSAGSPPRLLFFRSSEPAGRKLTQMIGQSCGNELRLRCALLEFWAETVAAIIPKAAGDPPRAESALRRRFRQMFSEISEGELSLRSVSELAEQVHCSERHFYRLFSEMFGESFRVHQTETRLLRARRLLEESNDTVAGIASQCGYRHMSFFGSLFKHRFAMTPGEWRRQACSAP